MSVPYTSALMEEEIEAFGYQVGQFSYGRPEILQWGEGHRVFIGKYCSFATGVTIFLGGNHRPDWVTTYPFSAITDIWPEAAGIKGHPKSKGDVRIGNDVWLGRNCAIMSGVTVGDGAVIGAFAVVTKDVPPYAIVGGNPARIIRRRFNEETIERLLEIKWWHWPEQYVRNTIPSLLSNDVDEFLRKAYELRQGKARCVNSDLYPEMAQRHKSNSR